MKYFELKAVCDRLQSFKTISKIYRIENSIIKIEFDKSHSYFFDLTKGNSYIYKNDDFVSTKIFNAPFDKHLQKIFTKSNIKNIYTKNDDKILYIEVSQKQSYKLANYTLALEFTGIHTNAIILDESLKVFSALRLVGEYSSFREVKIGCKLSDLPPKNYTPQIKTIDDIDEYLSNLYIQKHQKSLDAFKQSKIKFVNTKLKKLISIKDSIKNESELIKLSDKYYQEGNTLLQNLHNIPKIGYNNIKIEFEDENKIIQKIEKKANETNIQKIINDKFNSAKKAKQKAKNSKIELENLTTRIDFFTKILKIIENSDSKSQIEILFSDKQSNKQSKKKTNKEKNKQEFTTFYIQDYKVQLGKNKKENIALLKNAKSSDIWMHLKDYTSSHLIISTAKKNISFDVLEECAKLVAKFSTEFGGSYLVDFTQRREVKLQENGIALYNKYDTIKVNI
jgi:predicted ribosome quality control (RQC) complex YloA/Tae2 family protein